MAKIVYNTCYGGFSLSTKAMLRYAELKGLKLWIEGTGLCETYWTIPIPSEDVKNELYGNNTFPNGREIFRSDPHLVQVVEELGTAEASGTFASLAVTELPSGTKYRIEEHDGYETVITPDDYEWSIAL